MSKHYSNFQTILNIQIDHKDINNTVTSSMYIGPHKLNLTCTILQSLQQSRKGES